MEISTKKGEASATNHHGIINWYVDDILAFTTATGMGGCGMVEMYGWVRDRISYTQYDALIKDLLNRVTGETTTAFVVLDVGRIICQVGSVFYNTLFTKALEANGFTYTEAPNPRHLGKHTQRLYQWILT